MDSNNDTGSESGYGSETTSSTETTKTVETTGDTSVGTSKNTSDNAGTTDKTAADKTTTEDVTGYTAKTDDKGEAKTAVTDDKPLVLDLKGLAEDSIKDIHEFAKAHGLTKEQTQGLVDKRKSDEDSKVAATESYKAAELEVYKDWENELKTDTDFGGQNFDHSVHNVNKLIREELPGLKNLLTTSGKRLPPSLMKDLNSVARKLYSETELVQGDKGSAKDTWHPTDFYKSKQ
jgi:hypothetical protein